MSLSKNDFERLRLAAPKVDHHGVSPNACFSIAADLHKGGKNKGAKLFQKRQARVEKFVIDETNVLKSSVASSTKLDYIVQHPDEYFKTSRNAVPTRNINVTYESKYQTPASAWTTQAAPTHNLATDNDCKILKGQNFNKLPRGWGGSGPGQEQHSFYRESCDPSSGTSHKEWRQEQFAIENFDPDDEPKQFDKYGNYNRRIKAWSGNDKEKSPPNEPVNFGDYNRKIKPWQESEENATEQPNVQYGNYNRRVKTWLEPVETTSSKKVIQAQVVQKNYNSLPRGFARTQQEPQQLTGYDF